MPRTLRALPVAVSAAALLAVTGCGTSVAGLVDGDQPSTSARPSTTGLAELHVTPETHAASYERASFEHWEQVERPGLPDNCDAGEATLYLQGQDVQVDGACEPTSGTWTGAYTGATITDASDIDIDHMVPLAEAWRSGAWNWTDARREEFANDLDQLLATGASANRSKSDQDPAAWLPEQGRCGYVTHWIAVKAEYGLTVDTAERDALNRVLASC